MNNSEIKEIALKQSAEDIGCQATITLLSHPRKNANWEVFAFFLISIDAHLRTRLRVIIWKQWKVPSKRQWGLQKLGVGKDLARLTAYAGDRYQWVVTKTCVVRAISKEKLTQAGLVSCLDYYNERHALKLH